MNTIYIGDLVRLRILPNMKPVRVVSIDESGVASFDCMETGQVVTPCHVSHLLRVE
jgi:hypothetical protein